MSQESTAKNLAAITLSLVLGLFLLHGLVSLLDDSLVLAGGSLSLAALRSVLGMIVVGVSIALYFGMGLTPLIPKRGFLPVAVFMAVAVLALIPVLIYAPDRIPQAAWLLSLTQVMLGLGLMAWWWRGRVARWPGVNPARLGERSFSWGNLIGFGAINVFVVVPGIMVYLGFCLVRAVDHLSGSFLALHHDGLSMQTRKYTRPDGKIIHLVPMMHIGEPSFYDQVARAMPTNATVLVEGVTDHRNLLERPINYRRMARSLGLAEQQEEFQPEQVVAVHADVDVEVFSKNTIEFLKLASLLHTEGLSAEVFRKIVEKSQNPSLPRELWDDILHRRNAHLLGVIQELLPETDVLVVPWGAAHMPGLARDLAARGFGVAEVNNLRVLRFATLVGGIVSAAQPGDAENPVAPQLAE